MQDGILNSLEVLRPWLPNKILQACELTAESPSTETVEVLLILPLQDTGPLFLFFISGLNGKDR